MKKKIIGVISVGLLLILVVCGILNCIEMRKVKAANQFLDRVFEDIESQTEEIHLLDTEEELIAWMEERYSQFFTQNGWETALENRIPFLSTSAAGTPQKVDVELHSRGEMENCYIAVVNATYEDTEVAYRLFLQMAKENNEWLINSISR